MDTIYIKRSVEDDGMPTEDGQYSTDLGYIEVFMGMWVDIDEEPEWWLEQLSMEEAYDISRSWIASMADKELKKRNEKNK